MFTKDYFGYIPAAKKAASAAKKAAVEPTPGDYKPDAYRLCGLGAQADRTYRFVPHFGIERL